MILFINSVIYIYIYIISMLKNQSTIDRKIRSINHNVSTPTPLWRYDYDNEITDIIHKLVIIQASRMFLKEIKLKQSLKNANKNVPSIWHNLSTSWGKGTVPGPLKTSLHDTYSSCSAMGTFASERLLILRLHLFLITRLAYPTLCTCCPTGSLLGSTTASIVIDVTPIYTRGSLQLYTSSTINWMKGKNKLTKKKL